MCCQQLFNVSRTVIRHKTQVQEAHVGGEVTSVAFARDSDRFVSRGSKLAQCWDLALFCILLLWLSIPLAVTADKG